MVVNGMVFLRVNYLPRDSDAFFESWRDIVFNVSPSTEFIDRFEHLNDFLANDFTDQCQYGTLMLELNSVKIPKYMQTGSDNSKDKNKRDSIPIENLVFMLKIRIAKETRMILVGAPDQIYGDPN